MRIAIYEGTNLIFFPASIGIIYKYATLMADTIFCGGYTVELHEFIKYSPTLPIEKQLKLVTKLREIKGEEIDELNEIQIIIKKYNKIKHKTTEEVKRFMGLCKIFNKCFEEEVLGEYKMRLEHEGLPTFDGPLSKSGLFKPYLISNINNELGTNPYTPFSEILRGISHLNADKKDITFLPFEFLQTEWGIDTSDVFSVDQKEALEANNCWLHTCLQLPNPYAISESELLLLRSQIENQALPFRQCVDEWLQLFSTPNNFASRITFLKEKIMPAANLLQQVLKENVIIQKPSNVEFEHVYLDILIGEVPIKLFFDFYYRSGSLIEETWNVIEKWLDEEEKTNTRLPVFAINYSKKSENKLEISKEQAEIVELIQNTKKYIPLD